MPHQLRIQVLPGYLHFIITGENSPETVRAYFQDVVRACRERGCPNALIEENLSGPSLGAMDVFTLVSKGSQHLRPWVGRIAYVDTNPAHDAPLMTFAETVAVNRGTNMRVFSDVAKARDWMVSAIAESAPSKSENLPPGARP